MSIYQKFQFRIFIISFAFLLSACGGVTQQAMVATAIQTIMSNTILGFAGEVNQTTGQVQFACGDGSGNQGNMSFVVPANLKDPSQLYNVLQAGGTTDFISVTFSKCVVSACQSSLTIDGGTANIQLGVQSVVAALTQGTIPAAFTLVVTNQTFTGLLNGTFSYSYQIQANYAVSPSLSISGVNIEEAPTPQPLSANGTTYGASQISALASGC